MAEGYYYYVSNEVKESNMRLSVVNPFWEVIDPNPDLQELFDELNKRCFYNALKSVGVIWCDNFTGQQARLAGKYESAIFNLRIGDQDVTVYGRIRLNKTLLETKARADLVHCLLHEMIHAYLFTTGESLLEPPHGKAFQREMERINYIEGTNITIFHNLQTKPVNGTKQCNGVCKYKDPNYGFFSENNIGLWQQLHPIFCLGTLQEIDVAKYSSVSPNRTECVGYYLRNPMNILNTQVLNYKLEMNLINPRSIKFYKRRN